MAKTNPFETSAEGTVTKPSARQLHNVDETDTVKGEKGKVVNLHERVKIKFIKAFKYVSLGEERVLSALLAKKFIDNGDAVIVKN